MKIAINGATTMNYPLDKSIPEAGSAGFEGIELWWDSICEFRKTRPVSDLKKLLDSAGIYVVDICPFLVSPFRDTDKLRATFQDALEVCTEIGCSALLVCPDFRPMDITKEEALSRHGKEFTWYAEQAKKHDIYLAIEPIGLHTLVGGPEQALDLIKRAGSPENLGMIIDTFHYMRSSITDKDLKQIPKDKLFAVHINDSEKGTIEELADRNRLYPTEGYIDLKPTAEFLRDIGYEGYVSVEVFNPELWKESVEIISKKAFEAAEKFIKL